MEIKKRDIPWNFAGCVKTDCGLASKCLRAKVWNMLGGSEHRILVVSPQDVTGTSGCPEFRDSTPVRYALGFKNFREHMYPGQYLTFMNQCIRHFGRTSYFVRRRGDHAMSPKEQAFIRKALRNAGVTTDLPFDDYEDRICWLGR